MKSVSGITTLNMMMLNMEKSVPNLPFPYLTSEGPRANVLNSKQFKLLMW